VFTTPSSALDAVNKLHAHVYKGSLLSVALKKRMDTLSVSQPVSNPDKAKVTTKSAGAPNHASRLIVRNIPFNLSEQDLRAIFLPYGPIHSIDIPLAKPKPLPEGEASEPTDRKPLIKGFAFVWMLSRKDAERAIEGCNGMVVKAGMAESILLDKQRKKKQRRLDKKKEQLQDVEVDVGENVDEDGEGQVAGTSKAGMERTIAVDWALSKDTWEKEKAKVQEGDEDEDMASSGSDASSSDDDSGSDDEESGSELGVHHSEDSSDGEDDGDGDEMDEDEDDVPVKPQLPATDVGTTLFVRNVPFEATEEELRVLYDFFLNCGALFSLDAGSVHSVLSDMPESQWMPQPVVLAVLVLHASGTRKTRTR
jgi:nucleolar protein 4